MSEIHEHADSAQPRPVETKQTPETLVPSLTKETWELLEFRLWSSFSKRLWVLLTSVLTIAGLLGLLGLDAQIKSRVDDSLKAQKEEFEKARRSHEARMEIQAAAAGLLLVLQGRFLSDATSYVKQTREFQSMISPEQLEFLKKSPALVVLVDPNDPRRPAAETFKEEFAKLKEAHPDLVERRTLQAIFLRQQHLSYWHLEGLRTAIGISRKDILESSKSGAVPIIDYYQTKTYPEYLKVMIRNGESSGWGRSGATPIDSLDSDARKELRLFLPAVDLSASAAAK